MQSCNCGNGVDKDPPYIYTFSFKGSRFFYYLERPFFFFKKTSVPHLPSPLTLAFAWQNNTPSSVYTISKQFHETETFPGFVLSLSQSSPITCSLINNLRPPKCKYSYNNLIFANHLCSTARLTAFLHLELLDA